MTEKHQGKMPILGPSVAVVGLLSILVFPETRRIVRFNLQQIRPALPGSTYMSIWKPPTCNLRSDVRMPFWRRWPAEYGRNMDDWKIHAIRAFRPSPAWQNTYKSQQKRNSTDYDAHYDALRELDIAIGLKPHDPTLLVGKALRLLEFDASFHLDRVTTLYAENESASLEIVDPQCTSREPNPELLAEVTSLLGDAAQLADGSSYPLLVMAYVALCIGNDDDAMGFLRKAQSMADNTSPLLELRKFYQEFLVTLGTLPLEAKSAAMAGTMQDFVSVGLRATVTGMAREAWLNNETDRAITLTRCALLAEDNVVRYCYIPAAASICAVFRDIFSTQSTREEWIEQAIDRLREAGAQDLANRLEDASRLVGKENHDHEMPGVVPSLVWMTLGHSSLFGGALLLLTGFFYMSAAFLKQTNFDNNRQAKANLNVDVFWIVLILSCVTIGGWFGSMWLLGDITILNWNVAGKVLSALWATRSISVISLVLVYVVLLLRLGFVALSGRAGGSLVRAMYSIVLPRALVYLACAYSSLVLLTWLTRNIVM